MRAFVLAGGAGTRLSPLTTFIPKGMIPIRGRPFIDYVIGYLSHHGIQDIVMLLSNEDFEVYRNHLEEGDKFGVRIKYDISPRSGTTAALKHASSMVNGTFLIYYGDVLTNLDISEMIRYHRAKASLCTIALSTGVRIDYGVGKLDSNGRIRYFEEKPILADYPVSIGVYLCEPRVLSYCSAGPDIASDVLPALVKKGEKVYGFITREPHHDIGSFKELGQASQIVKSHMRFLSKRPSPRRTSRST